MLRFIIAIVFAFGLFLNGLTPNIVSAENDIELVLIGIVVKETNQKPVNLAIVELVDHIQKVKQTFQTTNDGTFHFQLETGKQYSITLIDTQGKVIITKDISTVNKNAPEILKIILEANKEFQGTIGDNIQLEELKAPSLISSDD